MMKTYKKYIGMNFKEWCALDAEDIRKINYTLKGIMEGRQQVLYFTSEDMVV